MLLDIKKALESAGLDYLDVEGNYPELSLRHDTEDNTAKQNYADGLEKAYEIRSCLEPMGIDVSVSEMTDHDTIIYEITMAEKIEASTQPMALLKKLRIATANVRENSSFDKDTGCYLVSPDVMHNLFEVTHPKTEKCPYCNSDPQTTGHSYNCKCSKSGCRMYSYWIPIEFWNAAAASIAKENQK